MSDIVLSIIIPCYNNVNFTRNCLKDLIQLPEDHEIVIVDNNSSDGTGEMVMDFISQEHKAKLSYINCPVNLGFGRGSNKGHKHSRGRNVLFLNNDIRVKENHSNWTQPIIELCEQGYLVSANGGLLDDNFNFIKETSEIINSKFFYLSGWCLAASRYTFDKLILNQYRNDKTDEMENGLAWGPWNEHFRNFFEDDDLTWRARELGIPFGLVKVPVTHFGHMTAKKLNISSMYKESQETCRKLWTQKFKS